MRRSTINTPSGVRMNNGDKDSAIVLSEGDLRIKSTGGYASVRATVSRMDCPRYFEEEIIAIGTTIWIGMGTAAANLAQYTGQNADSIGYYQGQYGAIYWNGAYTSHGGFEAGDFLGLGYDPQRGRFLFFRNGVLLVEKTVWAPNVPIFPMITSSGGGEGRVAFAKTRMRYPIPHGFRDWEED